MGDVGLSVGCGPVRAEPGREKKKHPYTKTRWAKYYLSALREKMSSALSHSPWPKEGVHMGTLKLKENWLDPGDSTRKW